MNRTLCRIILGLSALAGSGTARAADPARFEWKDGDRVVLIGDTLIERDQRYGYLETRITAANPDKAIVFRNLGWSGDTVFGHARAGFGKPPDGFKLLIEHVLALKPTVLIVGYGMAESFDGEAGLPAFVLGLNALLDSVSAAKARLVLLSPIAHENLGRPLPDPAKHNRALKLYRDAIEKVARERAAWFVDLYEPTALAPDDGTTPRTDHGDQPTAAALRRLRTHVTGFKFKPLTDNGIHPAEFGHWYLASVVDEQLRGVKQAPAPTMDVRLDQAGKVTRSSQANLTEVRKTETGVRFTMTAPTLPMPLAPREKFGRFSGGEGRRVLGATGLVPGTYSLRVDGKRVATAEGGQWGAGLPLSAGPEFDQVDALRSAIIEKNQLYFYRWRPQNETYLLGFRKHEQGNNAREIPLFDPLVEAKEKEIAKLRVPVPHVYELTRDGEVAK